MDDNDDKITLAAATNRQLLTEVVERFAQGPPGGLAWRLGLLAREALRFLSSHILNGGRGWS